MRDHDNFCLCGSSVDAGFSKLTHYLVRVFIVLFHVDTAVDNRISGGDTRGHHTHPIEDIKIGVSCFPLSALHPLFLGRTP